MTLTEKYRPKTLGEVRGQDHIVRSLARFAASPSPKAFILHGASGTGKTSIGLALARGLGVDVDKGAWGGLHEIPSGECTAETIRELFNTTLRYSSWHGSGWKVVLVNEADNMSDKASYIWLDVLEKLPSKVVVVFTSNDAGKFSSRFKSRCECYRVNSAANGKDLADSTCEAAAQQLIDDIWLAELGHNHSPRLAELEGWNDGGNVNFRGVVQALEPRIREQGEIDAASKPVKKPCIRVELPAAKPARMRVELHAATLHDPNRGTCPVYPHGSFERSGN